MLCRGNKSSDWRMHNDEAIGLDRKTSAKKDKKNVDEGCSIKIEEKDVSTTIA